MSVQSLIRVMVLRDAEQLVLEAGKVPSLRRKGAAETLAMPAIEAKLLEEFAQPLIAGRADDWPHAVTFVDGDGQAFAVTVDKASAGLRLVVRKAKVSAATPTPAPATPGDGKPWWAGRSSTKAPVLAAPPPTATIEAGPDRHQAAARLGALLAPFIALAREREASDVILSTGQAPRLRAEGRVEAIDSLEVDDAELAAVVAAVGNNHDLSLDVAGVRVRANVFEHLNGAAVAARLIRDRVPSLADLGLPLAELSAIVEHRDGLVLVCGPTGSGKSTTLASLIDLLDQRRAAHVITLEDPIEYRFTPRRCIIHQREVGSHIPTFAAGLRAALREAPDVILLGELRDRETIAAALTAAETGHLVLATLHAPSATGAIDRMIDAFPDVQQRQIRWQLAAALRCVVTQYLLPRKDGGRVAAVEIVPVTTAVANIMRKGDLHTLPTAIQSGREAGMVPLERSLARLIDTGIVSAQVVKKIAADHDLLAALSGKLR